MGCFMRTPNGKYPQYHTSADDLSLVSGEALAESMLRVWQTIEILDKNHRYLNLNPKCEPQLGRRGLYRLMGGTRSSDVEAALLWVLNYSDGEHALLDIAEKSKLDFQSLNQAAGMLMEVGLLKRLEDRV
jgi:aminopeptidase-like protein